VFKALAAALPEKFAEMAAWMNLAPGVSLVEGITCLAEQIGIPAKMSAMGVTASQLEDFTQEALQIRRLLDNCPVPLDGAQIQAIYQDAL
jgi:alcohol dehydrogenase class IV